MGKTPFYFFFSWNTRFKSMLQERSVWGGRELDKRLNRGSVPPMRWLCPWGYPMGTPRSFTRDEELKSNDWRGTTCLLHGLLVKATLPAVARSDQLSPFSGHARSQVETRTRYRQALLSLYCSHTCPGAPGLHPTSPQTILKLVYISIKVLLEQIQ